MNSINENIKLSGLINCDQHRPGVFNVETNVYKLPIGWLQKPEEIRIIGETDEWYVYKLLESEYGEWVGPIVIKRFYIHRIGIHKSRLSHWLLF